VTRERLRERFDTEPNPFANDPKGTHYVIVRKGKRPKQYLRSAIYVDMKEEDKWTTELQRADRFLNPKSLIRYAHRMLGHENIEVERLDQ
jgi:hypothetical protein